MVHSAITVINDIKANLLVLLILCQHHYSESKIWDLRGLRPHSLLIDCDPALSTEPTGPHCGSLTILSYIELSIQAPSYNHNLFTRVYTLTQPPKLCINSPNFQPLVRALCCPFY